MQLALLTIVAALGAIATIALAVLLWRAARRGAPRELQLGYLALMLLVGACSMLVIRVL